jgi:Domain of unknown function (DUF4265)
MSAVGQVKIFFNLDPDDWHGYHTESMWAEPVGPKGVFVLKNSPFFTHDVCYLDIVRAAPGRHVRGLDFAGLVLGSGHSTCRFLTDRATVEAAEFKALWAELERLGCTYEGGSVRQGQLYSVDVPPATDLAAVRAILQQGQDRKIWIYEEGRIAHPCAD